MAADGLCECGCGSEVRPGRRFRRGHAGGKPCGVGVGQRYGRLVVTRDTGVVNGERFFECFCDCGSRTTVGGQALRSGGTRSCGCLRRETARNKARALNSTTRMRELVRGAKTTHGMTGTREYSSWMAMVKRCENVNHDAYGRYRDRAPCPRLRGFDGFYSVLGDRPDGTSIDRIDNDGGYWCGECEECRAASRPLNVRWATAKQQRSNQRPPKRRNSKP